VTVALSGQVSNLVRTSSGGNSTVVVLPGSVTLALPAYLRLGADFGTANIRVAVFNDTAGWRIYDPYVIADSNSPIELDLQAGDSKLSIGRDSGVGLVGWTVVAATA
jgi:hypothetical protein